MRIDKNRLVRNLSQFKSVNSFDVTNDIILTFIPVFKESRNIRTGERYIFLEEWRCQSLK